MTLLVMIVCNNENHAKKTKDNREWKIFFTFMSSTIVFLSPKRLLSF